MSLLRGSDARGPTVIIGLGDGLNLVDWTPPTGVGGYYWAISRALVCTGDIPAGRSLEFRIRVTAERPRFFVCYPGNLGQGYIGYISITADYHNIIREVSEANNFGGYETLAVFTSCPLF